MRYSSIFCSSSFSFWSSMAFISLFFWFNSFIYLRFCIFMARLFLSFSSYSRIAASAFIFNSFPSSISYLYWLTYCLMTCLCCFLRSFSNFLSFFFSYSFLFFSLSSPFFTWFWVGREVPWFLRGRIVLVFSQCPGCIFLFQFAVLFLEGHQSRGVYC